jgi:hypothetical protein
MIKPQELWDGADWLDWLDGWHEECGLGFKSKRDLDRVVRFDVEQEVKPEDILNDFFGAKAPEPVRHEHAARALFDLGRDHRIAHRQATGV